MMMGLYSFGSNCDDGHVTNLKNSYEHALCVASLSSEIFKFTHNLIVFHEYLSHLKRSCEVLFHAVGYIAVVEYQ